MSNRHIHRPSETKGGLFEGERGEVVPRIMTERFQWLEQLHVGVNSAQLIPGGGLLFVQNMSKNIAIAIFFAIFGHLYIRK
jgi:hypothetical protein